jgi:hypothetical protein
MKSMTKKAISHGAVHSVPADLRKALISDPAARAKWEDITPSRAMSGSAGLSPSRNRKTEGSTLSVYARNLKKECADLVAGQAVLTAEIRTAYLYSASSTPTERLPSFNTLNYTLANLGHHRPENVRINTRKSASRQEIKH